MSSSRALISQILETREVNGVLTTSSRRHVFTCQSHGPPPCGSATCPHSCLDSRHFPTSDVKRIPFNLRIPECMKYNGFPDPMVLLQHGSDGYPLSSQFFYSRIGAPNLWALTLRTSEFARSLDLCHLSSSDGQL